jgi:hypothetical protein
MSLVQDCYGLFAVPDECSAVTVVTLSFFRSQFG